MSLLGSALLCSALLHHLHLHGFQLVESISTDTHLANLLSNRYPLKYLKSALSLCGFATAAVTARNTRAPNPLVRPRPPCTPFPILPHSLERLREMSLRHLSCVFLSPRSRHPVRRADSLPHPIGRIHHRTWQQNVSLCMSPFKLPSSNRPLFVFNDNTSLSKIIGRPPGIPPQNGV